MKRKKNQEKKVPKYRTRHMGIKVENKKEEKCKHQWETCHERWWCSKCGELD